MDNKFVIFKKSEMHFVDESDILYFGANGSYCFVFLVDGAEYKMSKNMKHVFEKVDSKELFHKIHQSYIVNKKFIKCILKDEKRLGKWLVKLENNLTLPANANYIRSVKSGKKE